MKWNILHESRGRIRLHLRKPRMSLAEADQLQDYLTSLPGVRTAAVYERTCDVVIVYTESRAGIVRGLAAFRFDTEALAEVPANSPRAVNREYQEKLVNMTIFHFARKLFLPAPLCTVYTLVRSVPYIFRGLRCVFRRKLKVEVLDALSIGVSMLRGDFGTAGSVMFLLRLGELLEEWTRKKSLGDLARCMSLNVDRVWQQTAEGEVLQIAACLEEHYPHSMANAVVQAAAAKGIRHDEMHSEVQYVVAHGIASQIGGEKAVIGSQHFVFEDEGCCIPTSECGKFDALPPEYSHLYLAIGGVLAGVICIADPLREEAFEVLKQLRGFGIRKAVMMTGDNDRTASVIAKQVGVDSYYAEVLPEDKAMFVEQEKAAGHTVIMLGDGINDSPALSAADVGIAISDGAAIAREIADVTIAADSLRELVLLKSIANGLQKRTESNYRFIMSFNSTLIVLGAMGILPPATSALLHNASTLGVSLKSMTNLLD